MKLQAKILLAMALLLSQASGAASLEADRGLVLQGAKVYSSPTAEPIENAVVLIQSGKIVAVGKRAELKIPASVEVIDCAGKVVVAGFWNSHVHFETGWGGIAQVSPAQVESHLHEILPRWGFTTVWDLKARKPRQDPRRRGHDPSVPDLRGVD